MWFRFQLGSDDRFHPMRRFGCQYSESLGLKASIVVIPNAKWTTLLEMGNRVLPTVLGRQRLLWLKSAPRIAYRFSGIIAWQAAWADAGHQRQSCLISIASNRLISGSRNWATQWNLARVVSLFRYLGAVFLANKS